MPFLIEGIGTAVPPARAPQSQILAEAIRYAGGDARAARALRTLYRRSGIQHRGSVLLAEGDNGLSLPFYAGRDGDERASWPDTAARMHAWEEHSLELAAAAARSAIDSAAISTENVTRLVVVTCTGFHAPGLDLELIRELGLPERVKRAQIGFMGCHGAINGLEVARSMAVSAPPGEHVLLVAVELCSLHAQSGAASDDVVANALFADGAAALVGRDAPSNEEDWALVSTRSVRIPDTADAMTWSIGTHGFRMSLSAEIPGVLRGRLGRAVDDWLAEAGMSRADVRSWAVHPGGVRILDAAEQALSLSPDALEPSRRILREHGNMSSPTILFVLDAIRRSGGSAPCVMLAFGPGLMVEMARVGGPSARVGASG